jgi:hypothetical protein
MSASKPKPSSTPPRGLSVGSSGSPTTIYSEKHRCKCSRDRTGPGRCVPYWDDDLLCVTCAKCGRYVVRHAWWKTDDYRSSATSPYFVFRLAVELLTEGM